MDLSGEPWQASVQEAFKQVVTSGDGAVRGAPFSTASAGGILYNKPAYAGLGLTIPKPGLNSWPTTEAILKDGTATPVIQTYGNSWTSQLIVLSDFYNVRAANPEFPAQYTAGTAKFATDPGALRSFEKLQEVYDAGMLNKDYAAASYDEGLRMLANGEGVHFPITSGALQAISVNYPDKLQDVGFFPTPGDNADSNGLTARMPQAVYIANTSANVEAAKKFVAFVASPAGCAALNRVSGGSGPYLVQGCELYNPPAAVTDMLPFFASNKVSPALEFLSPIKGPAPEQITVSVGSGIMSAVEGAKLYDEDVRKQAQQLGIAGW
ncbi:ABC transporter substrate-binding protein (plasmid) [Devosia sp. A8/3-2]|nr:ABC transporter substrate-binding protein [Devosia sp. A8/3-2]